eukprot:gnl/Hemi2/2008_TR715_c0_g1_i1.p1 gnl/Hemi2/2008_TR715_c0_g1~~gnl/Hemi2/2008_TR715_c0_g1_i1.p1  ORF type:complete len:681 (-),score=245.99 gnl/Hemi2/2008_TR715_c0_g1_i1:102-2144(-)
MSTTDSFSFHGGATLRSRHYPLEPFIDDRLPRSGLLGASALRPRAHLPHQHTEDPTYLSFNDSFIGDEGVSLVAQALARSPNIHTLDLRGSNIRAEGAVHLADIIRANTTLVNLNLEWNAIGVGDKGVLALCEALSMNSSIQTIDLRNNHISPEGGNIIAQMLKSNVCLQNLDVRWNEIGSKGARAIVDALQYNNTLTSLQLDGNKVSDDLLDQLDAILKRNRDISTQAVHQSIAHKLIDREVGSLKSQLTEQREEFDTHENTMRDIITQMTVHLQAERERLRGLEHTFTEEKQTRTQAEGRADDYQQRLQREIAHVEQLEKKLNEKELDLAKRLDELHQLQTTCESIKRQDKASLEGLANQLHELTNKLHERDSELSDVKQRGFSRVQELEDAIREEQELRRKTERDCKQRMKEAEKMAADKLANTTRNYEGRINELQIHIKSLEADLMKTTDLADRQKREIVDLRLKHEENMHSMELRMKREEAVRLEALEHRITVLAQSQDHLQKKNQKQVEELAEMRKGAAERVQEYEQIIQQERALKDAVDRRLRESQAQTEAVRTEMLQVQYKHETNMASSKEARDDLHSRIREHDDNIRKLLEQHKHEIRLWSDRVSEREATIAQLRKEAVERGSELEQLKLEFQRRMEHLRESLTGQVKSTFGQQSGFLLSESRSSLQQSSY